MTTEYFTTSSDFDINLVLNFIEFNKILYDVSAIILLKFKKGPVYFLFSGCAKSQH